MIARAYQGIVEAIAEVLYAGIVDKSIPTLPELHRALDAQQPMWFNEEPDNMPNWRNDVITAVCKRGVQVNPRGELRCGPRPAILVWDFTCNRLAGVEPGEN